MFIQIQVLRVRNILLVGIQLGTIIKEPFQWLVRKAVHWALLLGLKMSAQMQNLHLGTIIPLGTIILEVREYAFIVVFYMILEQNLLISDILSHNRRIF